MGGLITAQETEALESGIKRAQKPESAKERNGRFIGFMGWILSMVWIGLFMLDVSGPLYALMNEPLPSPVLALLEFLIPLALTVSFAPSLSSKRRMLFAAILVGVCIIASLALRQTGLMHLRLLMFGVAFAGFSNIWRPLFVKESRTFTNDILRAVTEGLVFLGVAYALRKVSFLEYLYVVLPIIALACFVILYVTTSSKWVFTTKEISREIDESIETESHVWCFYDHMITGIGIGCMFASGISTSEQFTLVGIALLASGLFLVCTRERVYKALLRTEHIIYLAALGLPVMLLAPFLGGMALAVVGTIGLFGGRTRDAMNPTPSVEASYLANEIDLFRSSKRALYQTIGVVAGTFLSFHVLTEAPDFAVKAVFGVLAYSLAMLSLILVRRQGRHYVRKAQNEKDELAAHGARKQQIAVAASATPASAAPAPEVAVTMDSLDRSVQSIAEEYRLTQRQAEILMYLVRGRSANYIATECGISLATVKSHIYTIYKKTGAHNKQEIIDMMEQELQ